MWAEMSNKKISLLNTAGKKHNGGKKMKREFAKIVVTELRRRNGPVLSVLEAMAMEPIVSDGYETYAIQKDDVTFVIWIARDMSVHVKLVIW